MPLDLSDELERTAKMDIAARWLRAPLQTRTIFAIVGLILTITGAASFARADGEVALMNRVIAALRSNERLNGAKAYTAAPGVVVLYGMVFDDKDRALAERTANGVNGVTQVVDNLRTKTGKWLREEERINTQRAITESCGFDARMKKAAYSSA
jgi:hypothetical protein